MTELLLFGIPCFTCRLLHFTTGRIIGGTSVLGGFITTSQLVFVSSKSKGKKAKRATVSVSLMKQAKKATKCSQVPLTPMQDMGQTTEEEESASGQDVMSPKLDTMMEMFVDLSHRVQTTEDKQTEKAAPPPLITTSISVEDSSTDEEQLESRRQP